MPGTLKYFRRRKVSTSKIAAGTRMLIQCGNDTTITDRTGNNIITAYGNVGLSTTQKLYSARSIAFDGSGDFLRSSTSVDNIIGTKDFLLECRFYMTTYADCVLIDTRCGGGYATPVLSIRADGLLRMWAGGSDRIVDPTVLGRNTWYLASLERVNGVTKLYKNGVQVGSSYTDANNYGGIGRFEVGADDDGSENAFFNGYMDSIRVMVGAHAYGGAFTPPTGLLPV